MQEQNTRNRPANNTRIDLMALFYWLASKYKIVLACIVLFMLGMGAYTKFMVTPQYTASSMLYVLNMGGAEDINSSTLQMGTQLKWDYQDLLSVWEVKEQVKTELSLSEDEAAWVNGVKVSAAEDSRIVTITATSTAPQLSMDIANTYAEVASSYLKDTLSVDKPPIASHARLPKAPSNINMKRSLATGFILGLLLPCVVLTILFLLDDKVKTPEDVLNAIGAPTLATLVLDTGIGGDIHKSGRAR